MKIKKIIILLLFVCSFLTIVGCKSELVVKFDTDGANQIEDIKITKGDKITKPADPVKEGYDFVGWFKDEDKTVVFNFSEAINSNITLYAKFNSNIKYTVTFETNGGTQIAPIVVSAGEKISKPIDPEKKDFVFTCWFTDEKLTNEFNFNDPINENITLFAGFSDEFKVVVSSVSTPTFYANYLSNRAERENKKTEFFVKNKPFVIGDDNKFSFKPITTFIKVNTIDFSYEEVEAEYWEFDIEITYIDGENKVVLEKTNEFIDSVDYIKCTIDFSTNAIGKTFSVKVTPKNLTEKQQALQEIVKYQVIYTIDVVDGYNVTNAKELTYIDNRYENRDEIRKGEVDPGDAVRKFKEQNNLDLEIKPNNIIICDEINVTVNDVPSIFFYTEDDLKESDPDYSRALGSLKDYYNMYFRYLKDDETFNIYGNYFTINTKSLPVVVREDGKITTEGQVISHATLLRFEGSAKGSAKISDLNVIGNAPRVEDVVKSGGQIFVKAKNANFEADNIIASCFFITYFADRTLGTLLVNNCKVYDGFNSFIYNYGSEKVELKDSEMIGAGGPVIIQDHVEPTKADGGYIAKTKIVNCNLQSYVTGAEGWFSVVGATAVVPSIKGLDAIFNTVNRSILKTLVDGTTKYQYMNLICVNKSGSAQSLTAEKIKGSLSIDDNAEFDFGENNPYLKAMLDATYKNSAPAFQSSSATLEKGYGYFNGSTLCDVTGAPITDITNPLFTGDYMCIYFNGMALTFGYFEAGQELNK